MVQTSGDLSLGGYYRLYLTSRLAAQVIYRNEVERIRHSHSEGLAYFEKRKGQISPSDLFWNQFDHIGIQGITIEIYIGNLPLLPDSYGNVFLSDSSQGYQGLANF